MAVSTPNAHAGAFRMKLWIWLCAFIVALLPPFKPLGTVARELDHRDWQSDLVRMGSSFFSDRLTNHTFSTNRSPKSAVIQLRFDLFKKAQRGGRVRIAICTGAKEVVD